MYRLVVNLRHIPSINAYLPYPIIVTVVNGELGYWKAKAILENLDSYQILPHADRVKELIHLCNDLSLEALELKYKRNLQAIFEDKKTAHLIKQYIDRKMTMLIEIIREEGHTMVLDVGRKEIIEAKKINLSNTSLRPHLTFTKTQTGIHYRLDLFLADKKIDFRQLESYIIQDTPALIYIDGVLFPIADINAKKVRPFLNKESIFVKKDLIPQYFKSFILDIVQKAEVSAEGFDIVRHDQIYGVQLLLAHDYMLDRYLIDLEFDYQWHSFKLSDRHQSRTLLEMESTDDVVIRQVHRSVEIEQSYVKRLESLGLSYLANKNLIDLNSDVRYAIIQWVINHRQALLDSGISIDKFQIEGKNISLLPGQIHLSKERVNDWFDIQAVLTLGTMQIPFVDLLPNIKRQDPFFLLSNGSYFIIPQEWLVKYQIWDTLGEVNGTSILFRKSQLAAIGEDLEAKTPKEQSDEEIEPFTGHPQLKATLRPYQKDGVSWLIDKYHKGLGACLADDMGLGKTMQTLGLLNYVKDRIKRNEVSENQTGQMRLFQQERIEELQPLRALIILPSSLVFNWNSEIRSFSPRFTVSNYTGANRKAKRKHLDHFDIVLTTYQTALKDVDVLSKITWEYIILDESQLIKNRSSKTFQALCSLPSKNRMTLTGTPIENGLSDLWSQMEFINEGLLGSYDTFATSFIQSIKRHEDDQSLQQLKKIVEPYILRRRKDEVAKDLPSIEEIVVHVEMGPKQSSLYEKEKSAARNQLLLLDDQQRAFQIHALTALLRLRQLSNHPSLVDQTYEGDAEKVSQVIQRIDSIRKAGHKILIFSSFTGYLDIIADHLERASFKYCSLTGASSAKQREKAVNRFQKDDRYGVFLISIKAGGTGLNLTAASYVFLLDPWWNPFVEEQAKARAHRIGQDKAVTVYKFIARNTIEEKILTLQARKKVLAAELIEGSDQVKLSREVLAELLK